jgi:hypothetical protein
MEARIILYQERALLAHSKMLESQKKTDNLLKELRQIKEQLALQRRELAISRRRERDAIGLADHERWRRVEAEEALAARRLRASNGAKKASFKRALKARIKKKLS